MSTPHDPRDPHSPGGNSPLGYHSAGPPLPPGQWPPPYDQPPPPPEGPVPGMHNPHRRPRRWRKIAKWTLIGAGVFILAGTVAGLVTGSQTSGHLAKPASHHGAPAAPSFSPSATTPAPAPPKVRVHFVVTGTGIPSITYGSSSDNRSPQGGLGLLGDGVALPFRAGMAFRSSASYYSIDAQLEGGGDITCKIVVTAGPGYKPLTVSSGHASGQDNICSAQAAPAGTDSNGLPEWQSEN